MSMFKTSLYFSYGDLRYGLRDRIPLGYEVVGFLKNIQLIKLISVPCELSSTKANSWAKISFSHSVDGTAGAFWGQFDESTIQPHFLTDINMNIRN
jgi:hypothetical protein